MPRAALLATLHDSKGWSIQPLREVAPTLGRLYEARIVVVTETTSPRVVAALLESGWTVERHRAKTGVDYISDSRRLLLQAAVEHGNGYMQLTDMDRALHWARTYPEELEAVVAAMPEHGFTVYGRTRRAFESHPRNQTETERLANRVFSLIVGREMDITAGSRGASRDAAELILRYSRGRYFDSDSEWPLIIHYKGSGLGYREVEGLEWETRLKREEWVHADGRRTDIKEFYETNPESWVYRTMLAQKIGEAALRVQRELGPTVPS